MNHDSHLDKARTHKRKIIRALKLLDGAMSGEITKYINQAKTEIEKKYSNPKYLSMDQVLVAKSKQRDLELETMSKRTVQKWLNVLERVGLVSKGKGNVYSLTERGWQEKTYGKSFGKMLFDGLTSAPLRGKDGERLRECISRLGTYLVFLFLQVKGPTFEATNESISLHRDVLHISDFDWLEDSFSQFTVFEWFNENFFQSKDDRKTFYRLMWALNEEFPQQYKALEESRHSYLVNSFPTLPLTDRQRNLRPKTAEKKRAKPKK